jgi:hypothetical protein
LTGRQAEVLPALIMLAQWRKQATNNPQQALCLLQDTIGHYPWETSRQHAPGLLLARQGKREQALRKPEPAQPTLAAALYDAGLQRLGIC